MSFASCNRKFDSSTYKRATGKSKVLSVKYGLFSCYCVGKIAAKLVAAGNSYLKIKTPKHLPSLLFTNIYLVREKYSNELPRTRLWQAATKWCSVVYLQLTSAKILTRFLPWSSLKVLSRLVLIPSRPVNISRSWSSPCNLSKFALKLCTEIKVQ